ncbi:lipopolysaccharide assembly protein LapB [Coxiella burnetii]|uniref:Lipopolysaccharide assembly protein B n=1 Tax=Coxiella burnetii (strain RSA 493 / Nine Mile phase I) TaxID=227377 RepID=Q83E07_COXBU|nr:lipopolysaccharide assembly protein LapB [Coxiella burnetii]NP_819562.2 tetratricopeptide repeat family protein [Coxiella burnetii RSA 493]AAO90076.2 tetratricopeptide repeat family protein [Coxiella burnetii RSA 493]ACJ18763.1 tetratricopeptide repeat family protein [Coxiella burnetii CbuG_Q212]ARI65407.1 lipopolysaccharide assembly protein LapB [Coxiella burnetii]AZV76140.1 lipopolysaccharide assembly protein LapB [Coxiella burnetii]MCF2102302.1 lipopolysaccharide assembly protein LapB [
MMIAQALFLLLPMAAAGGWFAARRVSFKNDPKLLPTLRQDYFKGLNYLINEQPDKAVDVFIKLLEVDTDTVETHLALGSLFRRRGEVDRAIRVHQNLIARPQLAKEHRFHALSELGQDYLRAGVLDRAERLFLELVEMGEENQGSLRFLLHIYQQEKDWQKAIETAQKLLACGEPVHAIIAQYHCELAEQMIDTGRTSQAVQCLKRAQAIDSNCVRASLIQGRLESENAHYREAIRCYKRVVEQDPDYISEAVGPLVDCYQRLGEENKLVAYLEDCLMRYPRISLVLAISDHLQHRHGEKAAIEFIAQQIQRQPSLRGLTHLVGLYLLNSSGDTRDKLLILQNFMKKLLKNKPIYRCSHCGFSGKMLYWLCPSCQHWNTVRPIQGLEGN